MSDHQLVQFSGGEQPLWETIKRFSKNRFNLAVIFVLIGLTGIFLPFIPGFLFFLFAVALFKPGLMAKIRRKLNSIWPIERA